MRRWRVGSRAAASAHGVRGRVLGAEEVRLRSGLLHQWQQRSARATVPHALRAIEASGALDNFRRLAGGGEQPFRGAYPFLDTDVYKTLEGLAYLLADDDDRAVRAFYEDAVAVIQAAQAADGYLGTYFQGRTAVKEPWSDLAWGHELYNLGHLIQAALAASRRLGDDRLLVVAERFAELAWQRFGDGAEEGCCGHPEIEMALVELSRHTGEQRWLRLAELFVDRRGSGRLQHSIFGPDYFVDKVKFRSLDSATGHAVRMVYLAAGATDVAIERGDDELLAASERLFDDLVSSKLYVTGGLGARHSDESIGDRYELPSERAYAETCAAIGLLQWAWRLFVATGRADVLDVYEQVLYNALAVGVSSDGTAFFYDNPLQRRPDHEQRSGAEIGGEILRRPWFGCACCPPNLIRWMAQLQDHVALADDRELSVAVLTAATISSPSLDVTVDTDYPWSGGVTVRVDRAVAAEATLHIRIPGWVDDLSASIRTAAGVDATGLDPTGPATAAAGWLTVRRHWQSGDEVRLDLSMPLTARRGHPRIDAVRGAVTVLRGPIVYCLEQVDLDRCRPADAAAVGVDDVVAELTDVLAERGPAGGGRTAAPDGDGSRDVSVLIRHRMAVPDRMLYPIAGLQTSLSAPFPTTLVPYHSWGNRGPGPMRVWLPLS